MQRSVLHPHECFVIERVKERQMFSSSATLLFRHQHSTALTDRGPLSHAPILSFCNAGRAGLCTHGHPECRVSREHTHISTIVFSHTSRSMSMMMYLAVRHSSSKSHSTAQPRSHSAPNPHTPTAAETLRFDRSARSARIPNSSPIANSESCSLISSLQHDVNSARTVVAHSSVPHLHVFFVSALSGSLCQ